MSKGSPNDATRKLNFVAKVYDPDAKDFKPIYIAPEATSKVLGDVYLSDAVDSTDNAATGVTAATPAAVKTVQDNANNKLDKITNSAQSVKSAVTFNGAVTANEGVTVPSGKYFTGNLSGNATSATRLQTPRTFSVSGIGEGNSVTFDGQSNVALIIGNIDAGKVNQGTLPLSVIPKGALERVVSYNSVEAAVSAWTSAEEGSKPFDIGDTVRVTGVTPNVMYAVIADPSKEENYIEYAAGTATNAINAELADVAVKLQTARTITTDLASTSAASFDGSADITPGITGTLPIANGGTGLTVNPSILVDLESTVTDTVFEASPRPGITGTLPISHGGTGATTASQALTNLGAATANHTHSVFSVSENGFVPASGGGTTKFLRADGTWQVVAGEVTGVKGNAETDYRTGNVNLTPANIGAAALDHTHDYLPLTGGTLTGDLNSGQIAPSATNSYTLGTSSLQWSNVYATIFTGNLNGNATTATSATTATTATKLNKTLTLTGNVTGSVNLNAAGTSSIATTIANKAVTLGKLDDSVGTVQVGSSQPTDAHVKLWIKV